jgi:hypothetical protein
LLCDGHDSDSLGVLVVDIVGNYQRRAALAGLSPDYRVKVYFVNIATSRKAAFSAPRH